MFKKRPKAEATPEAFEHSSGSETLDFIVQQHVPTSLSAVPRGRDARMHPDEVSPIELPQAETA